MDQTLAPGEYFIAECPVGRFYMHFGCPCGTGHRTAIPIKAGLDSGDANKNIWWWNGKRDDITLNPSIFLTYEPCKWHGYLENGEWRLA